MQSDSKHGKYQSAVDFPPGRDREDDRFMSIDSRVMTFAGIHNFRDYGGYPVRGGRLRRGMLWRSGQHHGASAADLELLATLELAAVFDLRSDAERRSHPCPRPAGFAAKVFIAAEPKAPVEAGAISAAPHVAAGQNPRGRDAEGMKLLLQHSYATIPFRLALIAVMRDYLAELAAHGGASLIHCMAGKDRTGIAVAMLMLAVGVHHDDVMADYLLTNTAGDVEARIAAGSEVVRARSGDLDTAALRVLMGVEPEYLEAALAGIAARYGSVDAYLREVLGADDPLREKLRERLVEG